jgi:hypothetical protein
LSKYTEKKVKGKKGNIRQVPGREDARGEKKMGKDE